MIECKVEQRSEEWKRLRIGKITGTRLKDAFKSDNLTLVDEMISEIVTEEIEEIPQTKKMKRGEDMEPVVRDIYQKVKEIEIEEVGFCLSEDNDYIGLSPDGFTPDRTGAIEIKVPDTKTHVKYIRMGKIPNEYKYQVLMYFIINKRLQWLDFISFDDRFKSRPMWIKRVTREELQSEIEIVITELNKFTQKFEKHYKQIAS